MTSHTQFVEGSFGDLRAALRCVVGPFDLIICNPPYSSRKDKSRLSVSRRSHEPEVALYAPKHTHSSGSSGSGEGKLGAYAMIAHSLSDIHAHQLQQMMQVDGIESEPRLINEGAHLVLEMGHGQEAGVRQILGAAQGWTYVRSVRDHLDIVRCVVYRYSCQ